MKEEKKAYGLEDMDLPNARTPPPPSKMINCAYPEHFGQLLVIYTMLNAFGELLHLRPVQYGDLELALKECSPCAFVDHHNSFRFSLFFSYCLQ